MRSIVDGNLDSARKKILDLEERIKFESSVYNRQVLLERVKRLKKVYIEHSAYEIPDICIREPIEFSERIGEGKACGKVHLKGIRDSVVQLDDGIEAIIEDCHDVEFEHFSCKRSISLVNLSDCSISCTGQQIRMDHCNNVEIIVNTSTGVFLQDCGGIIVKRYGSDEGNMFRNVHDFSSPFDDANFKVL